MCRSPVDLGLPVRTRALGGVCRGLGGGDGVGWRVGRGDSADVSWGRCYYYSAASRLVLGWLDRLY